jgi:hypothetical protein
VTPATPADHGEGRQVADVAVRAYRPGDRQIIRDICCRTAFRNLGLSAMLDDPELFGDYWTAYYTDYEPESILVAETEGKVIAYLTGCTSTRRHVRIMAVRIVPRVLARLAARTALGRYRNQPRVGAFLRWLVLRSWREAPPVDIAAYPAHCHVNVCREGHGRGLLSALSLQFLDILDARGLTHLHAPALDRKERGPWERLFAGFRRSHPDVPLAQWDRDSTLGRAVLGLEWDLTNRAWGFRVDHGRAVFRWFARHHHL